MNEWALAILDELVQATDVADDEAAGQVICVANFAHVGLGSFEGIIRKTFDDIVSIRIKPEYRAFGWLGLNEFGRSHVNTHEIQGKRFRGHRGELVSK